MDTPYFAFPFYCVDGVVFNIHHVTDISIDRGSVTIDTVNKHIIYRSDSPEAKSFYDHMEAVSIKRANDWDKR